MNIKRKLYAVAASIITLSTIFNTTPVSAAQDSKIKVEIISPGNIESTPIYEGNVEIAVTNCSDVEQKNLECFLTVVDEERKQTFAMDEFGVDSYQTREIDSLQPGETVNITIPVRVMYVGKFKLIANVVNYETGEAYVANLLPTTILSNTSLHKNMVWVVSGIMPVFLTVVTILLTRKRGVHRA